MCVDSNNITPFFSAPPWTRQAKSSPEANTILQIFHKQVYTEVKYTGKSLNIRYANLIFNCKLSRVAPPQLNNHVT